MIDEATERSTCESSPIARRTFTKRSSGVHGYAAWVRDQYPNEGVKTLRNGRLRVSLRVSEQAWLDRLLLRLGTNARLVQGDTEAVDKAARRILARYRDE